MKKTAKISKFLSLVLRHEPEKIGITLDSAGWVGIEDLLRPVQPADFQSLAKN